MRPKRKIILTLLLIFVQMATYAQFESQLKHHVIIALDEVMSGRQAYEAQKGTSFNTIFKNRLADTILREGDFVSIVGFSIDGMAHDLNTFTYVIDNQALGSLSWKPYTIELKNDLEREWSDIMDKKHRKHNGPSRFSMISLAKLYAFAPVKKEVTSQYVNRTFLVLLTDRIYNGKDIYEEAFNLTCFNSQITPMMMQDRGQRVSAEYFVRQLNNDYDTQKKNLYIDLCEYIPLQSGLTLPTLLDYSAGGITARRIKGGIYHIDINTSSRHNPRYSILQLRYRVTAFDGTVLFDTLCKADIGADNDYKPIEQFEVPYVIGKDKKAASVTIDTWAALNDGIYNATVLTPVAGAPDYLASKGLSVTLPISYEPTQKILGITSLPGRLQFDDDQDVANTWISAVALFLMVVLLLASVFWLFHRIRNYHIKAEDIEFISI